MEKPYLPWRLLTIKSTRCNNFSNLFLEQKLYMFRTVPLSTISSFSMYTQQWYMSYRFTDSLRAGSRRNGTSWSRSQAVSKPVWHIQLLCVHWKTTDGGQRNCPKHVEFGTSWSRSQAVSKPVWHIPLLCVHWKTTDGGQRNCPKHVEFLFQK